MAITDPAAAVSPVALTPIDLARPKATRPVAATMPVRPSADYTHMQRAARGGTEDFHRRASRNSQRSRKNPSTSISSAPPATNSPSSSLIPGPGASHATTPVAAAMAPSSIFSAGEWRDMGQVLGLRD